MAGKRSTGGDFDSYVVVSIDQIAQEGENTYVYVELFVTILAACLTSSMALFLCPVLLGAFGLEYLIRSEDGAW